MRPDRKRIQATVTGLLADRLDVAAGQLGTAASELVRVAVADLLSRYEYQATLQGWGSLRRRHASQRGSA
jgi:hypothetical protein